MSWNNEHKENKDDLITASAAGSGAEPLSLDALYSMIKDRKNNRKPGSYTTYLFDKGIDKMLKKLGEETTAVIIAGKAGDRGETVYEIADLVYHAMVLMAEMGITPDDVRKELESRRAEEKQDI